MKALIKERIRTFRNNRRLKLINKELTFLACSEDLNESFEHEKILMAEIMRLSKKHKEDNSRLTQLMHLYFAGLYQKGRLSLDKTARNKSIEMISDEFINHSRKIKNRFYHFELQKVIHMLIMANLSIHRVQHAARLLESYNSIFFESYRATLYLRILTATCGTLDIERVKDLFNNAAVAYEKECSTTQNKANFLKNLYIISKGTCEEIPGFEELLSNLCKELRGDCNDYAVQLFRELCMCNEHMELVKEWLDTVDADNSVVEAVMNVATLYASKSRGEEVAIAKTNNDSESNNGLHEDEIVMHKHIIDRDYPLEKLVMDIDRVIDSYSEKSKKLTSLQDRLLANDIEHSLRLIRPGVVYWRDYEENFLKVKPGQEPEMEDKVFFFVNDYSLVNGAVTFPFLLEARRRGIKCYSVSPRIHLDSAEHEDDIRDICGMFEGDRDLRYLTDNDISKAEIDIPNKRIIVQGMNIYQPVFEFVTRYQFTYFYNYETDAWARYRTVLLIRRFSRLFRYIERVEKWAVKNGKTVYFLSNAPHLHNAAAFRIYCEEKGYKNGLNYICTSPGYDNYFANATDPRTETTTALNLTTHPHARNSFLGTEEGFNVYYENNKHRIGEIREKMQRHLEAQRGRKGEYRAPEEKEAVRKIIEDARAKGKKVLLLNGKVIIDLAVKYTKGVVHSDMSEWITHAVKFAKEHPDEILLLIKPHPHENREDLTMTSEEIDNLRSIIKTELADNTIYLDNDMFTNNELVDYIDLGMVWNGTSSLEFAAQGKRVLIGDVWGHYDYPIGFVYPETLEEYEAYMLDSDLIKEDAEICDKAITFLEYMGSDDVRIANDYSLTTLMNFNQYESEVNEEAVDRFVSEGDGQLKEYFDSLLN